MRFALASSVVITYERDLQQIIHLYTFDHRLMESDRRWMCSGAEVIITSMK